MKGIQSILLAAWLVVVAAPTFGQLANDNCTGATVLNKVSDFCSSAAAFTNVGAGASGFNPTCFTASNDVWFTFVATGTDVSVTVIGNTPVSSGGTLKRPRVALVTQACGSTQTILQCATTTNNILQIYKGSLTIGQTYYIQVATDDADEGTFQLCVNNYNAIPAPQSDCIDGVVLCDKSPFTVESVSGGGADPDEAKTTSCLGTLGGNSESNSTWYIWTCDKSGTLTFTLTPSNPSDDLDFVVFELPNYPSCSGKTEIRCMASGSFNTSQPPCMGPTGLRTGATDLVEYSGCTIVNGKDNYLAPLNMVSGTTYALLINNFTSTGNGFNMSFGGTGTFLGPKPNFTISDTSLCIGETLTFTDSSTGAVASRIWNFGVGAVPQTATGAGPHTVTYTSVGTKYAVLIAQSNEGCQVTKIRTFSVLPCCETVNPFFAVNASQTNVLCADDATGSASAFVLSGWQPMTYQWNNGQFFPTISNLTAGNYALTVTDNIGCDTVLNYQITEPPHLLPTYTIVQPTCAGGKDGSITMSTTGGVPPYQYNFGNGFTANPVRANIPNGIYNVTVRDANNCDTTFAIQVWELVIEIDTLLDFIKMPSCYGYADGSVSITLANGTPPYRFDWGNGFTNTNTLTNLTAGAYTVTIEDVNLCRGTKTVVIPQPDSIALSIASSSTSCFAAADGEAIVTATGGTPGYLYHWSNGTSASNTALDLIAGIYTVTVTDVKGCQKSIQTTVSQPAEIYITQVSVQNTSCFGIPDGSISIQVQGGTPPFEYSLDGTTFQTNNTINNLAAGAYTIVVRDAFGCLFEKNAVVNQPWELWIRAGDDQTIKLGYSTAIDALVNTNPPVLYQWNPPAGLSCSTCEDPIAAPSETTTYTIIATDVNGCTAIDSLTIFVDTDYEFFIPNAFSPNLDGNNDYFYVQSDRGLANIPVFKVFDRWGNLIYEAYNIEPNNELMGWDGTFKYKKMRPAVFAYIIELEFLDGYRLSLKGDVTLLE